MKRLYQLARKGKDLQTPNSEDSVALQYLISNYEEQRRADESIFREESWAVILLLYV